MDFETRAALARETLARFANEDVLDPQELLYEVSTRIRQVVPHGLGGWMTLDPDTLLPTGNVRNGKSPQLVDAFWRNELLTPDLHKFTELARRRSPLVTRGTVDAAAAAMSPRYRSIHEPAGLGDELRVVFRSNRSVWGAACLHRATDEPQFSPVERRFLIEISTDLGRALQASLSRRDVGEELPPAPGVVTLDRELRVVSATAEAEQLVSLFPGDPSLTLFGVAARAHGGQTAARSRVRLADGRWLLLHAAHLDGSPADPGRIAVILDPAPRAEVVPLLLRLHGLSVRELEVSQLLLTGIPTDEVAVRLHISRHTLRDHVKSIFTKVGANSRSELTALLAT